MNENRARELVTHLVEAASDCGNYAGRGEEGKVPHDQKRIEALNLAAEIVRHLVGKPLNIESPFAYRLDFGQFITEQTVFANDDAAAIDRAAQVIDSCVDHPTATLYSPDGIEIGKWGR